MTTKLCDLRLGDTRIEILCRIGQVLNVQTWNSTHVSGGGAYSDAYGNVRSTPVSSHNVRHHQFFLRTREGQELEMNTTNVGVGLRAGHEITLVLARKHDHWEHVGILNHNTLANEVWPAGTERLTRLPHRGFLSFWGRLGCLSGLIAVCFGVWAFSQPRGGPVGMCALLIGLALLFSGMYSLSRRLDMDHKTRTLQAEVARILQHLKGYQTQAQAAIQGHR